MNLDRKQKGRAETKGRVPNLGTNQIGISSHGQVRSRKVLRPHRNVHQKVAQPQYKS
jgi:hypothetical protein